MKFLKSITHELTRIANSLLMIEITLMKINGVEYSDLKGYAKDYNKVSKTISENLEDKK